jgi:hypothetical protein
MENNTKLSNDIACHTTQFHYLKLPALCMGIHFKHGFQFVRRELTEHMTASMRNYHRLIRIDLPAFVAC